MPNKRKQDHDFTRVHVKNDVRLTRISRTCIVIRILQNAVDKDAQKWFE